MVARGAQARPAARRAGLNEGCVAACVKDLKTMSTRLVSVAKSDAPEVVGHMEANSVKQSGGKQSDLGKRE
jgi:hypothetical protein